MGKNYPVDPPAQCPFCGAGGCLIGHGWYRRKGLWDGQPQPFYIRRFRCKHSGKTLSVHPPFAHRYKRYSLQAMVDVVGGHSDIGVCDKTAKRWKTGLRANGALKALLCTGSVAPAALSDPLSMLVGWFDRLGAGVVVRGAALAMICLAHDYQIPLY